jgi:hypothetical protein
MTPVDWIETVIFIGLSFLAIASKRADFILMFAILLAGLIWGRAAIAFTSPLTSVLLCAAYQAILCLALAWRGQGAAGMAIGALFAVQFIAAGFTMIGVLSAETSVGPAMNYWTWMTTAALLQDLALVAAYFLRGDLLRIR